MTEARPRPWTGALLGLLLGVVVTGLLWLTGVVPPDRLPLFGILAVCMAGAMALTTQRLSAARGSTITVIVISSLLGGVALTGIPEFVSGGTISNGCTFQGTSSQESEPVSPDGTSALSPFDVSTTDTVQWSGAVPESATQATVDVGLAVGGFDIPLYTTSVSDPSGSTEWSGSVDVAAALADFKDSYAFDLTGTYHFTAQIQGDGEGCSGAGYTRVIAPSAFSGVMLAVLWALLAVLLVAIIVVAVVVRRSMSHADALASTTTSDVPPEDTIGTGGPIEHETAASPQPAAGAAAGGTVMAGEAARRDHDAPDHDAPEDGAPHDAAGTEPDRAGHHEDHASAPAAPAPTPEPAPTPTPEPMPDEADRPRVSESRGDADAPATSASADQPETAEEAEGADDTPPEEDPRGGGI